MTEHITSSALGLDEALTTTRSVRRRLDLTKPVPRDLLLECLELAVQAPTGSNRQDWQFVFVTDAAAKRAVAEQYGRSYDLFKHPKFADEARASRRDRVVDSSDFLREHLHEVPAMLIPLQSGRLPATHDPRTAAGFYGSIFPAVWSFMLAARSRGLGTVLTTAHLRYEREVAHALQIPFELYTQVALVPVAFYTGAGFKAAARVEMSTITHFDRW